MTEFDFSSILIAKTDGDVCGPDGCLPGEEPAVNTEAATNEADQKPKTDDVVDRA